MDHTHGMVMPGEASPGLEKRKDQAFDSPRGRIQVILPMANPFSFAEEDRDKVFPIKKITMERKLNRAPAPWVGELYWVVPQYQWEYFIDPFGVYYMAGEAELVLAARGSNPFNIYGTGDPNHLQNKQTRSSFSIRRGNIRWVIES